MAVPLEQLRDWLRAEGGRLYAGRSPGGLVLAPPEQALLVLGPPRSGKTSGIAVPNVLCAPGPVVATSTKADVMAATAGRRADQGRCWLLDPSGSAAPPEGVTPIRWSPVAAARRWDDALVVARSLSSAGRPGGRLGESAHWTERAEALLAPLLLAAHMEGAGMERLLGWVLRHDLGTARSVLAAGDVRLGVDVLAGLDDTDPREQSGIWSTAAGILAAYRSERVLDRCEPVNFDPARLHASGDTVFICAPGRHQELVAPILVAFVDQVVAGAYAGPGDGPPLTLVLDELANIAPLPDLASIVSEGGGQGVLTLGCLQDLSQARQRWGAAAEGFLSLFGAKLVLPGIGDMATLDLVSRLAGETEVPSASVSRGPWWTPGRGPTTTWSGHRQRRLPVEAVSQQRPGGAVLITGADPPARVELPPWWAAAPFGPSRPPPGRTRTIER